MTVGTGRPGLPKVWPWLVAALLAPSLAWGQAGLWAEASVGQDSPRVQETVVYTVRVFSPMNLQSVELTPPSPPGAAVEELGSGTASSRTVQGRSYVVNEYRYALTPITAGTLEVGPARLTVWPASGMPGMAASPWGSRSIGLATHPLRLTVQPLPPDAPIPLRLLEVEAQWSHGDTAGVGEPLTLTVVSKAVGAVGARLPSVAPLVEGRDFKVYPERPQLEWAWGGAGDELLGRRTETFTIVPTREGNLTFPALDVAWWDLTASAEAHARVEEKRIRVGDAALTGPGGAGAQAWRFVRERLPDLAWVRVALPVAAGLSLAFLVGWWVGTARTGAGRTGPGQGGPEAPRPAAPAVDAPAPATLRSPAQTPAARPARRPPPRRPGLRERLAMVIGEPLGRALGGARRVTRRLVVGVAAATPLRVKAWWCVRCAVREEHPEGLCRVVQHFACRSLNMAPTAPLPVIGERLRSAGEREGTVTLPRMLQDLDRATYAGHALDLGAWKREFRRRFRRAVASSERARQGRPRRGLPDLNP